MTDRPAPRMAHGGAGFLAAVLEYPGFERDGLLFGVEGPPGRRLHWVVLDPAHHALHVWRKSEPSFPRAGRGLGASVFTSGPFTNHAGGAPIKATAKVGRDVVGAARAPGSLLSEARAAVARHWGADVPLGHVIGEHEGIRETSVDRPRVSYFGRRAGTAFTDYEIGIGDPPGLTEAIGGLFRPVTDYEPYSVQQLLRTGFWGLAPLVDNPVARGSAIAAAADRGCSGLVVFAAELTRARRLAAILARVGVKDAVQIDGGDSLLLGRDDEIVVGRLMPPWKRSLQVWGVQFRRTPQP